MEEDKGEENICPNGRLKYPFRQDYYYKKKKGSNKNERTKRDVVSKQQQQPAKTMYNAVWFLSLFLLKYIQLINTSNTK